MLDLQTLHSELAAEISAATEQVIRSSAFVGGPFLRDFEREAADYLGVRHAIGVASGTDALSLSLRLAGVGPGDEVVTTAFSFWASAEAIHNVGARAVYVDIDPRDMNLDPACVRAAITERTRAIMPVHIFGQCADMQPLLNLADAHGLALVEDACQAFGARYQGRAAGSFGLAGCFSFYPSKPLGCFGDGGLITSNDDEFAERLRYLNNHGADAHNRHSAFGFNSRLDALQAAVLSVKLRHLDRHLRIRRALAAGYAEAMASLPLRLPQTLPGRDHCFAQFTIRCEQRNELQSWLAAEGIASAVHYPLPLYRQPACAADYDCRLPEVETCTATCLSLPLYQGLAPEQQGLIAQRIGTFFDAC